MNCVTIFASCARCQNISVHLVKEDDRTEYVARMGEMTKHIQGSSAKTLRKQTYLEDRRRLEDNIITYL